MVKRAFVFGFGLVLLGALLWVPYLGSELLALFFIGIIPYSTATVPVWLMFLLDVLFLVLVLHWLQRLLVLATNSEKRDAKQRRLARAKVRRLSRQLARQEARKTAAATPKTIRKSPAVPQTGKV